MEYPFATCIHHSPTEQFWQIKHAFPRRTTLDCRGPVHHGFIQEVLRQPLCFFSPPLPHRVRGAKGATTERRRTPAHGGEGDGRTRRRGVPLLPLPISRSGTG